MPGGAFLEGERVELCTVEQEDVEFIQRGMGHPAVNKYLSFGPRNVDNVQQWYEATIVEGSSIVLLVVPKEGEFAGEPIGAVSANPIAKRRGIANIGAWLVPEAQLQNYAEEAGFHFVEYLFEDYGMRKLSGETYETNRRIQRLLERFNFTEEGRKRKAVRFDGEWIDLVLYGLLRSEYPGYDEWRDSLAIDGG